MPHSIPDNNLELELQERVSQALANGTALAITGGGSKSFYGQPMEGEPLELGSHTGIIDYDPAELVITLRAGCKLADVEALLAENHQMLGFEPLHLGENSTIGGVVASGLAGPRRAWAGGVREFILGAKILSGRGEIMNFGGRVIKNVAGFDVSRLMVGALGTLGVMLELSLRLIPCFETELTLGFEHRNSQEHTGWINTLSSKPIPLSASLWYAGRSTIRLSGSQQGVASAARQLGGDKEQDIWPGLRQQNHEFFVAGGTILRLSLPQTCEQFLSEEIELIEWGGAQRWMRGDFDLQALRQEVEKLSGSLCVYHGAGVDTEIFQPLGQSMMRLHRSLKSSFDPAGILNPGRLYPGL
jgi:glycolate oxidase FAD binding subunit